MKISIVRRCSAKTGKCYGAMEIDLGYRKVMLFPGDQVCAEVLGINMEEYYTLPVPYDYQIVGDKT